jgi:PAS domain S-box-containing protein
MLALMFTLPGGIGPTVVKRIGPAVILMYPLATILAGKILSDQTEASRVLKTLKAKEERYERLFNSSNDAIFINPFINGKPGNFIEVNDVACTRLGYSRAELLGRAPADIDAAEMAEARDQAMAILEKDGHAVFEMVQVGKSGKKLPVEISSRIFESDGRRYLLSIARDILDRKRAEEALQDSERKLKAIVYGSPIPQFVINRNHEVIYWNKALEDITGIRAGEVIGTSRHWQAFYREKRPCLADLLADEKITAIPDWYNGHCTRSKHVANAYEATDFFPLRGKGEGVWLYFTAAVIRDAKGSVIGAVETLEDITERKLAENALRQSEAKMRNILDNIEIGVALISPKMEILEMNRRMREWYPAVDQEQHPFCYHVLNTPPREAPCHYCPICKTLQNGGIHEATMQRQHAGVERHYRIISSPVLNASGEVTAAIEIVEDITERLSLEAQLRQAQKMEAVGRLAGGVAHDFNNMLGVIMGHTELALDGEMDPNLPLHANLQEVMEAARRSADLTRQLLAFARKQTVAPKMLNLNETVEGMLKMLRRLIGEDIDLAWLPETEVWPIKMDPSQIDQILANLCVNARDAIAGVGKVTIETANDFFDEAYCADHPKYSVGEYVMLAVSDNGCGMSKATQDRLFEPFFTTKERGKGTGLGLATVYGIVKQNNGFINVYSEPGHGSTFRIYLPRHADEPEPIRKKAPEVSLSRGHETILLVEDAPAILNMVKLMLAKLGYRVLTATTPAEAIRMAEQSVDEIHLLMTDVIMPGMNGRDLAKKLVTFRPGIRHLFMSGYTDNVIAHHGVLDEGVNYIQKPFSKSDLAIKVREALDS